MKCKRLVLLAGLAGSMLTLSPAIAEEILVPGGGKSIWKYLDAGKPAGAEWAGTGYDAAAWKEGAGPLGYGEEGLGTTVSFGDKPRVKPVTTYFRRTVEIADPAKVGTLVIELKRDDGAVVYWNGKEIARSNLPSGAVKPETLAEEALSDDDEGKTYRYTVPAAQAGVVKGANVLAVEVHQADARRSDLFFDLKATALAPGEEPKVDYFAAAVAALQKGAAKEALPLLLKIDPAREGYAAFMLQAAQVYARTGGGRGDGYFQILDKARAAAPADMEVVYTWIRAKVDARRDLPVKPAARKLPAVVPDELKFITADPVEMVSGRKISKEQLLADVDDLELILENCYAYLERRGTDYRAALDALRASITEDLPVSTFQYRVERLLTVFGDPHSRLSVAPLPVPRVPALFVAEGDKVAVLKPDRSGYYAEDAPWLAEVEGRPASEFLAAAEHIVSQASPQYRRNMALTVLAGLPEVCRELRPPVEVPKEGFKAVFQTADGSRNVEAVMKPELSGRRGAGSGPWPETESELRSDGIGYLRIPQMDSGDDYIASLNAWMKKFAKTKGIIIDVRDNGGGTQDTIKTLLPWLMKPGSPMKIINVAAYRLPVVLPEPNPSGFLGLYGRGLHPVTSKEWTPGQAEEIRQFLAGWTPKWKLPEGKFSDWHVMAVTKESNREAGYYDKPVIVLQDAGCFSATDNFLGALKGHPGVTLMGTASGGGSGRMARYTLPNSRLPMTLCQMASFATTGMTYDGNGVPPDVVMEATLDDYLKGKGDSVLDAALKRLSE